MTENFYQSMAPLRSLQDVMDESLYRPVPDDWLLAVGDIQNSTKAVASGRYADVNFVASAMIAALTNLCGTIPFQFGGDGASALIPPEYAAAARRELARVRGFAALEFKLGLRVGLVGVAEITKRGGRILVGRYEPSPDNSYAQFLGNGVDLAESALKGRGDLTDLVTIAAAEDDGTPPNLSGLSCRWNPIKPIRGRIVALVTKGADSKALHAALLSITGTDSLDLGSPENFDSRWPPKHMMLEVRARRGKRSIAWVFVAVLLETLLAYVVIGLNRRIGKFDPTQYRQEVFSNLIFFSRTGDSFCVVFDCAAGRVSEIRRYLEDCAGRGQLKFGMHEADSALMTCLVGSAVDGQHIHFADGGDGGYTSASIELKAAAARYTP
jgi:hypothetical protein